MEWYYFIVDPRSSVERVKLVNRIFTFYIEEKKVDMHGTSVTWDFLDVLRDLCYFEGVSPQYSSYQQHSMGKLTVGRIWGALPSECNTCSLYVINNAQPDCMIGVSIRSTY